MTAGYRPQDDDALQDAWAGQIADFQPPDVIGPELDDDDRMYGVLTDLASLDLSGCNLRDHPEAYKILDRLLTHGYAEGRKDERWEWLPVLEVLKKITGMCEAVGNFANGVTDSTETIDEGEVMAGQVICEAKTEIERVEGKA